MIEMFVVYHLSFVNIVLKNIILLGLIIVILMSSMVLVLFSIDTKHLTIIKTAEKPTIHVGGICQLIQFTHLNHGNRILIIIIIHHRSGTNYRTSDEVDPFVLITVGKKKLSINNIKLVVGNGKKKT